MPVEGAAQGLIAAFTFGFVVNSASAALFLYTKGHGSTIFRDSQRLVLILFLFSAALWAQIDFVTVLLDITRSSMSCQVGIIFATVFDQLARFSVEQYLVWAMNNGVKPTVWQMVPQFVVLGRFVAGAVFSGFTRPQTDTFCVATSPTFPIAVVVIVLDVLTLLLLTARAFSSAGEIKDSELARRVSIKLVLLGFAIWTASSVPLLLGIRTVELVARTAVPAIGLTILIIIVTGCAGSLGSSRGMSSRTPEAPSPRRVNISRDISTSDSDYPPSRYEDVKEAAIRSSTTFVNPREAPTFKDDASAVLPFMAGPGVFSQSEADLPMPANAASFGRVRKVERSGSVKGGLFGFGKPNPSITVAKAMIGNPILQDNDAQNPLNKIATIGLDEAARAERERRAKMQAEPVVPARPLTQMSMSPEEVMKRGVSVRRKEVASVVSQTPSLQPDGTASTTAAQLSPGVEEIRRRSPRQPSVEQMPPMPQPVMPVSREEPEERMPQMGATQPWLESPPLVQEIRPQPAPPVPVPAPVSAPAPVFAQKIVARPEIRPSRQAPPSPKAPAPEPEKSLLQRRPTIGLPTNPRARAMKIAQENGAQQQQQQTVMFVNNIVYNDPTAVQNIIKGANDMVARNAAAAAAESDEASVVNRPRPIPRKGDAPQPSPSPKHKRSKSGGSISRKSALASAPGSPTQLPPLPPPPVSGGVSIRPQPNSTKSMTVDEKMTMFFPSPPSGNATKRRSPAPQLPPIPISYLDTASSPTESRRSNRTTKTSFKTDSILDVDEIPRKRPADPVSRFSPMTEMNLAEEVGASWLPGIAMDNRSTGSRSAGAAAKRASSPVIPPALPTRSSAWTETTEARTEDDTTTNWGTVHSPELAVGVQVVKKAAQPSNVRGVDRRAPVPGKKQAPGSKNRGSAENITFMLDELEFDHRGSSWLLESEPTEVKPERSTPSPSQWHRRVGDECPTFSAREKTRSRKAPAPSPLMLNGYPTKNTIVIQAEPSPLTSPEHALQEIQAQLKKLEESNRDSLSSPSRRLALLENLEREMGQQEDHWQEMKHDMGRDSMTSVQTMSPGKRGSRIEAATMTTTAQISREPATRTSIASERRMSRRARMRNNGTAKPAETHTWSPELERTTTTNTWQKRLTEAQTEYLEVAAELLRVRDNNSNFMSLSKAQLGSPTPPDSDQSDEEMPYVSNRLNAMVRPMKITPPSASLWKPSVKQQPTSSLMWAPVKRAAPEPEARLPSLSVRPILRKEHAPLQIYSSELWRMPYQHDGHSGNGLWRPVWASAAPPAKTSRNSTQGLPQSQKAPRPLTQRPPRRSKRMTLLPDILESPEPLPDKRGTLGIFQFPWGERSDTAFLQTRSTYMAMPGTMASGGPSIAVSQDQRSRQLESAEYSSSFFDDYDDDEEENSDEGEGEESDDGFDETTLWEIASLLKTDAVPSKNSMFPPTASNSVVEEYMDDIPSDEDGARSSREQSILIGLGDVLFEQPALAQQPPRPKGRSQAIVTDGNSDSWTLEEEYEPKLAVAALKPTVFGLPANPKASKASRTAPPAPGAALAHPSVPKLSQIPRSATASTKKTKEVSVGLWEPARWTEERSSTASGMYEPNSNRASYRTTSAEPAAKDVARKSRPSEPRPLEHLSSTRLWTAATAVSVKVSKLWSPARLHRPSATIADWDDALKDALAASHRRTAATPEEWDAALQDAIQLAVQAVGYDIGSVHPVFFGSLTFTCPRDAVHPAFAAYANKKLRRHRSKVSTRERPASRGRTLSRSDSARKEDIRAQIRALEEEQMMEQTAASMPTFPDVMKQDTIMAQIEALEQERLFVQQAAQAEYLRRTSLGYGLYSGGPVTEEPEPVREPVLLSAEEVVAQQQRRLSMVQRRGSVARKNAAAPAPAVSAPVKGSPVLSKGLWSPPARAQPQRQEAKRLWTPMSSTSADEWDANGEDGEAFARRARGRKAKQKVARRAEILAQIAAIENDIDLMADYKNQRMWSVRAARVAGNLRRNWLHERKPSRVMLRR